MGEIKQAQRAKLFTGIITGYEALIDAVRKRMTERYGPVDIESAIIPFTFTDYYRQVMGDHLLRKFLVFEKLIDPQEIGDIKRDTNALEDFFSATGEYPVQRPVNIDPGYVVSGKLILATTKDYSHRVYLRDGIYAEVTMSYKEGSYRPHPWTFPDFQTPEYIAFFNQVRQVYRRQIVSEGRG